MTSPTVLAKFIRRFKGMGTRRGGPALEGTVVWVQFDESGDSTLAGRRFMATIRAVEGNGNDVVSNAAIELHTAIDYRGHYEHLQITHLVTHPYLVGDELERIRRRAVSVRIIDCEHFDDADNMHVIGLGFLGIR